MLLPAILLLQNGTASAAVPNTTIVAASPCVAGSEGSDCRAVYTKYINPLIALLSAIVGVVTVAMIIFGGIQFSSAGSDPQKVAEAKKMISNAVIGLIAYTFLFGVLNWLIPGGLL